MARKRQSVIVPPVRTVFCEGCGEPTDSKRTIVVVPVLRLKRLRCHCCRERLQPKVSKRDAQTRVFTVSDPTMPGLEVFACEECAGYCENCRYDWED